MGKMSITGIKVILLFVIPYMLFIIACGNSFLDVKPDKRQRIPQSLEDYQAMLDNTIMNVGSAHILGMVGADEFTISEARWNSFPLGTMFYQKNAYVWDKEPYGDAIIHDYNITFQRILVLNVVLDGVRNHENSLARELEGNALFLRARWYAELAQMFCPAYEKEIATSQLGLPMYLNSDITIRIKRESLFNTYVQIINDLKKASEYLPEVAMVIQRPNKAAAYALLARLYLLMDDYENAFYYSDQCLKLNNQLLDFNKIDLAARYPFPSKGEGNPEILFMNTRGGIVIMGTTYFNADEDLLASYGAGDLRRDAYYFKDNDGRVLFKGSYFGNYDFFSGFATDEMYLTRSESNLRIGKVREALIDLNHLRKHRIHYESYILLESSDNSEVLDWIIAERRKELVLRGTRWEDLRRLNRESRYRKTLTRVLGLKKFELKPNDSKWTWPLPDLVVDIGGYKQNVR